jgi:hypothetical protein
MDFWSRLRKWDSVLFLLLLSALAYLPNISHFGYFRDDWYLMYSANAFGGDAFHAIYASDRPMRALLMSLFYSIFGLNPFYYNLSVYVCRLLGAFAFLWTLQMLWPRQRNAALIASALFLLYPGFLSTPNAIDYQAQQFGLFLAMLSIALSVRTVLGLRPAHKIAAWVLIGVTAVFYLGFVEYFLGLEVFRFALIFLLAYRSSESNWLKRGFMTWLPFALGPLAFLTWRFFFFESTRRATDLGAQISRFFSDPLLVGVEWAVTLLKDIFEVIVLSWGVPFYNLWNAPERLREWFFAGLLAMLAVGAVALVLKLRPLELDSETESAQWQREAFWVGLVTVVAGFVPVILSNRDADFASLSRYMLASSVGAVILLAAFISQFKSRMVYVGMAGLLIAASVLTHYFNGLEWARSSKGMQDFWWQVSWRVPQLQAGSTLVLNYSHSAIEEDYFIWGPANLIYHPQSTDVAALRPAISGLVLHPASVASILAGSEPDVIDRRSIRTVVDYGNILILSQPTLDSCVQVIDGRFPFVSEYEQYDIQQVAGKSNLGNVITDEKSAVPMQMVFGAEPEHGWCYYYQSAALALQRGDLQTVLTLKQEAQKNGYAPADPVEWSPFLQAAALLGDHEEILEMARPVKKSLFLEAQACKMLTSMPDVSEETRALIQKTFCVVKVK